MKEKRSQNEWEKKDGKKKGKKKPFGGVEETWEFFFFCFPSVFFFFAERRIMKLKCADPVIYLETDLARNQKKKNFHL